MRYVFALFFLSSPVWGKVHHQLEITLAPALKSLTVTDTLQLADSKKWRFRLNKNLQVRTLSSGDQVRQLSPGTTTSEAEYELLLGPEDQRVTLQYTGILFDPVTNNESSGLITPEGAVLFGSTFWVPDFAQAATFEISELQMPPGWKLASPSHQTKIPQQDIYLIAGAFEEYTLDNNPSGIPLKIFLREVNPALAQTFLNFLPQYLTHYQTTLGPYPYESFSVIENFWETGFGMPAFTLLGPGVIRLPYILNSSLPHEVLHNWWGNSVYVDYDRGNWCEALTTYLADHWQQEILKADRDYRRQALMNFQDYTQSAKDFPLREFKQRFNFSSQAVGYGKGMMVFHMLRKKLGESVFSQGLREIYQTYRGQSISYEEIEKGFARVSGFDLKLFFKQWLDRTGAPSLKLEDPRQASQSENSHEVRFKLRQVSPQPYELLIPLRFSFADGEVVNEVMTLHKTHQEYKFHFSKPVKTLEVDPEVDLFRDLDYRERPTGFSSIFGSSKVWILGTDDTLKKSFQHTWQKSLEMEVKVAEDSLLQNLPSEGAVVLLGDSPAYEKLMLKELQGQDFTLNSESITLLGTEYPRSAVKTALVARSAQNPRLFFAWIRGPQVESLAPRLLHFGKFGILVFNDTGVALKSTWPLLDSPLKVKF